MSSCSWRASLDTGIISWPGAAREACRMPRRGCVISWPARQEKPAGCRVVGVSAAGQRCKFVSRAWRFYTSTSTRGKSGVTGSLNQVSQISNRVNGVEYQLRDRWCHYERLHAIVAGRLTWPNQEADHLLAAAVVQINRAYPSLAKWRRGSPRGMAYRARCINPMPQLVLLGALSPVSFNRRNQSDLILGNRWRSNN